MGMSLLASTRSQAAPEARSETCHSALALSYGRDGRTHGRQTERAATVPKSMISTETPSPSGSASGARLSARRERCRRLQHSATRWTSGFTSIRGDGTHSPNRRQSGAKREAREAHEPVTRNEATHHFRQSLMDSKWEKVPGWHCLRHSFISILASDGVDQRLIDDYVGHTTEDMRRRYRHLLPETKAKVLKRVFG